MFRTNKIHRGVGLVTCLSNLDIRWTSAAVTNSDLQSDISEDQCLCLSHVTIRTIF